MQRWGSHCTGFSCGARALGHAGSVAHRPSSSMARGILAPGPGMEPVSPELAGRFLTLGPPESPSHGLLRHSLVGKRRSKGGSDFPECGRLDGRSQLCLPCNRVSHPRSFQGALQAAFTVDHCATGGGMRLCGLISLWPPSPQEKQAQGVANPRRMDPIQPHSGALPCSEDLVQIR